MKHPASLMWTIGIALACVASVLNAISGPCSLVRSAFAAAQVDLAQDGTGSRQMVNITG